jgi:hypothetical protein
MTAAAAVVDDNPYCYGKHNYKEQDVGQIKIHRYSFILFEICRRRQALRLPVR